MQVAVFFAIDIVVRRSILPLFMITIGIYFHFWRQGSFALNYQLFLDDSRQYTYVKFQSVSPEVHHNILAIRDKSHESGLNWLHCVLSGHIFNLSAFGILTTFITATAFCFTSTEMTNKSYCHIPIYHICTIIQKLSKYQSRLWTMFAYWIKVTIRIPKCEYLKLNYLNECIHMSTPAM